MHQTVNRPLRQLIGRLFVLFCVTLSGAWAPADEPQVIARLNGHDVTADQLQLEFYLAQLPADASAADRQKLLNRLIDRELIRQYLNERKTPVHQEQIDLQLASLEKLIVARGETMEAVLTRLHLTPQSLREILETSARWEAFSTSVIGNNQIHAEWEQYRTHYDGTRVQASQIVRLVDVSDSTERWEAEEALLGTLREEILQHKLTFADAARQSSQSPSARRGGDMGEFEYSGRVDEEISRIAFITPTGEISKPFRTRFGVHLVQVARVIPGQLSLEDARPEIIKVLGERLWADTVLRERQHGSVQILKP